MGRQTLPVIALVLSIALVRNLPSLFIAKQSLSLPEGDDVQLESSHFSLVLVTYDSRQKGLMNPCWLADDVC